MTDLYDITLRDAEGRPLPLRQFAGSPLLVVNVASYCGLTPQYRHLQALHRGFHAHGLNILACPCNQFDAQEPCPSHEIAALVRTHFGVSFPITEKLEVNGPDRHDLYRYLIGPGDDIEWNFAKFLLDGDGGVIARYVPTVSPTDNQLISTLRALLQPSNCC